MIKTELQPRALRSLLVLAERNTGKPFRVVADIDPAAYDDPDFALTIGIETFDPVTGRTRGAKSTHTGRPQGKSGRWACGMLAPPVGLKTVITIEVSKQASFGVNLEEADEPVTRTGSSHRSIAFDEFDYAETSSSASTLDVTGVTVDSGDLLVALASVFNSSGSTMTVSDPTNGTWSVATGSPVLPAADSQAHIQYFSNSAALSAASVTFNPTGASSDIDAVVVEVSGAATSAFDQYVEATGAIPVDSGATATVTTGTLAQTNNLIFSVCTHTAANRTFTEDAAFTLIAEDEDNGTSQAFHAQRLTTPTASTGAVTATVVLGSAVDPAQTWGIAAAVFKEAAPLSTQRTRRPHPISAQYDSEDEGHFNELDVRNWYRMAVPA